MQNLSALVSSVVKVMKLDPLFTSNGKNDTVSLELKMIIKGLIQAHLLNLLIRNVFSYQKVKKEKMYLACGLSLQFKMKNKSNICQVTMYMKLIICGLD